MRRLRHSGLFVALCVVLAGCSASTGTVKSSGVAGYEGAAFTNILVIGVAQDYNSRARFERLLVSKLAENNVAAVAYYRAIGGNKPIDRDSIKQLVETEGFDAVLITRVLNRDNEAAVKSGSVATKTTRLDEGALHLFRYNYEELNEPETLSVAMSVKLSSEVFAVESRNLVWAIESEISKKEVISQLVDDAVATIVKRLKKDGLIG